MYNPAHCNKHFVVRRSDVIRVFVSRVWQLNGRGPLVEHWFSAPITDCLMTGKKENVNIILILDFIIFSGAKFLDPRGSSFCISSYDSSNIQVTNYYHGMNLISLPNFHQRFLRFDGSCEWSQVDMRGRCNKCYTALLL